VNRIIKRYTSRKLYDIDECRYVSLDEIADWVRTGDHIQVLDIRTGEDATVSTLTHVIMQGDKRGSCLPAEFLHALIRCGDQTVSSAVGSVQAGVGRLIEASTESILPLRALETEMQALRTKLDQLEARITHVESTRLDGN
jgi:polyhydroxyalkanoate synthesis repressor PhaR